ncbi:hypothetical protein F4781DRAFT_186406 [Annulohypoxylon bovei var. microspora]|nr:hypothetical protein F4781DRAFT_186406 [Annulohypoxylon bovei var. microspora]
MWTFQEIIVSKNVLVRCGSCVAPWTMLTKAAHNINTFSCSFSLSTDHIKALAFFKNVVLNIEDVRTRWGMNGHRLRNAGMDLQILLQATNNRKSSDDRDRVYALLGLLSHDLYITPDYHARPSDVYIRTARAIIRATGGLDVLSGNLGRKNRSDLPTWVPDWSALIHGDEIRRMKVIPKLYNACKSLRFTCWVSTDSFWDMFFANIATVSRTREYLKEYLHSALFPKELAGNTDEERDQKRRWAKHGRLCNPKYNRLAIPASYTDNIIISSDQFIGHVDVKTLESLYIHWMNDDFTKPASLKSDFNTTQLSIDDIRTLVFDLKYSPAGFERLNDDDEGHLREWFQARTSPNDQPYEDILGFDFVLSFMSSRRRFFMTATGRFGWGPEGPRPGDQVFVVPGGKTPFVLRGVKHFKRMSTGQLIGDCYLQGVMDGQQIERSVLNDQANSIVGEDGTHELDDILASARAIDMGPKNHIYDLTVGKIEGFASFRHEYEKIEGREARSYAERKGLETICIVSLE